MSQSSCGVVPNRGCSRSGLLGVLVPVAGFVLTRRRLVHGSDLFSHELHERSVFEPRLAGDHDCVPGSKPSGGLHEVAVPQNRLDTQSLRPALLSHPIDVDEVPIVDESHPTEPICSYGIVKLALEKYLALYQHLYGLESISLRISNLYGEHQRHDTGLGVIASFCHKAITGQIEHLKNIHKLVDKGHYTGMGVGIGLAVGAGIGAALGAVADSPAIGTGIGIALGAAIGAYMDKRASQQGKVI